MAIIIKITLVVLFVILGVQDIKTRYINGWLLIPIAICLFLFKSLEYSIKTSLTQTGLNLVFLLVQLFLLSLFYIIKEGNLNLNDKIGKGDLYLFIVLALGFSFKSFIVFYLSTLIMCLLITVVMSVIAKREKDNIPLVSYVSANWLIWLALSSFTNHSIFGL